MRLTRRADGGFRLEGAEGAPIEGVPGPDGLALLGRGGAARIATAFAGRGATWSAGGDSGAAVVLTWGSDGASGPSSLLLPDGRLLRIAVAGLSEPCVEVSRWDVPGPYLVARPDGEGWTLERTAAGEAMGAMPEILLAASYEIGRRDGWW